MTKNTRIVLISLITVGIVLTLIFVFRDLFLSSAKTIQCEDGPRRTIDIRKFTIDYWTYSFELEATIKERGKFTSRVAPVQLQQLSEAQQQANEFRKYVVAGYNSCAISKAQYAEFGRRFQTLDSMSRQINALLQKSTLSPEEKVALEKLVKDYSQTAITLGQTSQ